MRIELCMHYKYIMCTMFKMSQMLIFVTLSIFCFKGNISPILHTVCLILYGAWSVVLNDYSNFQ